MMRATGEPARIFISHSYEDDVWCRAFVTALTRAGANVWYDERDMEPGRLDDVIEPELRARPIFIVVLSPSSVASQWVQREVAAAIRLQDDDATRTILPVLAATCAVPKAWNAHWRLRGPRDRPLLPLQAAARAVEVLNKRRGLALRTVASPAITDLYDTERGTFRIHLSRSLVIAACLTGIAAFLITGFFGHTGIYRAQPANPLDQPFTQPWLLYLWLGALLIALQCAILRDPSLRARLVATLVVTLAGICVTGITYFSSALPSSVLSSLVPFTPTSSSGVFYSILNVTIIGGFWLSMLYRWRRRARHLPLRLAVNIGLEETVDLASAEPDLPRLIGGDLVVLAVVASVLAVLLRADVINALTGMHLDTCAVTLLGTGCVSPGDAGSATTLAHIDTLQALVYFPVGFILIMGWAFARRRHGEVERDDVLERLRNALLDFLVAVREAFVQRVPRILGPALALRLLVWVPLLLLSTYAAAATSTEIQSYLHARSDSLTLPVQLHAVPALLFSGTAYLTAVVSIAIQLLRWRIVSNTTRFVLALVRVVVPWLWVFPLGLSAANALVSVAHLSQRVPFPQPDVVTVVLLAAAGLSVAPRVVHRVRAQLSR